MHATFPGAPRPRLAWASALVLAALIAFPLIAPLLGWDFYVSFVRRILIFTLVATSLNFILGFGGMVALGHAAFFGAGAYTVAILASAGVTAGWVAWPAAMAIAGLLALVTGAVSLRTRGVYFIMITLAFAQMLYFVIISLRQYGGEDGLNLPGYTVWPGLDLANDNSFYYVTLALVAVAMGVLNRLIASPFGEALQGVRENPERMTALGYPVYGIRLVAYVVAGAFAGLAGALLANHNLFVSPSMMHWTQSANLLIMVIVGGIGMRYGGAVGAAVLLVLEEVLRLYTEYWHLPLGLLLLAVLLLAPSGLAGLPAKWLSAARGPVSGARP